MGCGDGVVHICWLDPSYGLVPPLYDIELENGLGCAGNRLGGVVGWPYTSCGATGETEGMGTHCGGYVMGGGIGGEAWGEVDLRW